MLVVWNIYFHRYPYKFTICNWLYLIFLENSLSCEPCSSISIQSDKFELSARQIIHNVFFFVVCRVPHVSVLLTAFIYGQYTMTLGVRWSEHYNGPAYLCNSVYYDGNYDSVLESRHLPRRDDGERHRSYYSRTGRGEEGMSVLGGRVAQMLGCSPHGPTQPSS